MAIPAHCRMLTVQSLVCRLLLGRCSEVTDVCIGSLSRGPVSDAFDTHPDQTVCNLTAVAEDELEDGVHLQVQG